MTKSLLILPLVLLGACVSPAKYKAKELQAHGQMQRADALDLQLLQARKDLEAAKKVQEDLQVQLKTSGEQLAALQTSNKDLQDSLAANKGELTKKVSGLIKERDALAQKTTASDAQVEELAKKLAQAQAARQALEDENAAEIAKVKKSYEDLTSGLKSEIAAGEIKITELKGKLTVNMVDRILFDSGQAEVKTDGKKILEKVGGLLNNVLDKDIRIEGHTDNKPITGELRGRYPSNWELSTARATAVARYLEDHAKVDPRRLVAAGYGEFRPVASNDSPESRALNRRIEIILVPRE